MHQPPRLEAVDSVVIPRLQEIHSILEHPIDQPMLVREPPGADVRTKIFERLGLSDAFKRVSENRLEQIEKPERKLAIVLDEIS